MAPVGPQLALWACEAGASHRQAQLAGLFVVAAAGFDGGLSDLRLAASGVASATKEASSNTAPTLSIPPAVLLTGSAPHVAGITVVINSILPRQEAFMVDAPTTPGSAAAPQDGSPPTAPASPAACSSTASLVVCSSTVSLVVCSSTVSLVACSSTVSLVACSSTASLVACSSTASPAGRRPPRRRAGHRRRPDSALRATLMQARSKSVRVSFYMTRFSTDFGRAGLNGAKAAATAAQS